MMRQEADILAHTYPLPRLQLSHGIGCQVWDDTGKSYLDFTAGLGVTALGHGDASLAKIAGEQFARLAHCSNLFANAPALALGEALLDAVPSAARVWFCNSGAESIEAAFKFARLLGRARGGPRQHTMVSFTGSFHGRTMGALALTQKAAYKEPFGPNVPGVRFVPFNNLEAAAAAIDEQVCGVVVEPVQGEGGVHVATPAFLQGLRALCDKHGAALICDEIQCGLGRTGRLLAVEYAGVTPDMVCLAKPLAGGLPIGATLIGKDVATVLQPGQHGSTFGGGPVSCAVGCEVLKRLRQPAFLARVRRQGETLKQALLNLQGNVFIGWRGMGLMQGLVLAAGIVPASFVAAARAQGLLISRAGNDVIRLLPPLVCGEVEIGRAQAILQRLAAQT